MQNPGWFPLEHFTQGVEVNFILSSIMIFSNLNMSTNFSTIFLLVVFTVF